MKIAISGLWYVGNTAAACPASRGHEVTGIDPSATTVNAVLHGALVTHPWSLACQYSVSAARIVDINRLA